MKKKDKKADHIVKDEDGTIVNYTQQTLTFPDGKKIDIIVSIPEGEEQEALKKYWKMVREGDKKGK